MNSETKPRKRGMTSLALQWVSERLKKAELIKRKVESGAYTISAEDVARSIVGARGKSP